MEFLRFCETFGLKLDPQQQAAVRQTQGPVLLLAVPGSGKTTVLLARIGCLIHCRGVAPERILTMTYTVAATQDMRRRFSAVFGEETASRLAFHTINGVCARIIRQYERRTGRPAFRLLDREGETARFVRDAFRRAGQDYPTESQIEETRTRIAFCKNGMKSDGDIRAECGEDDSFFRIYDAYRALLRENARMDYDDQMVYGLKILRARPDILAAWRARFQYFMVDEAQDTSRIQHEIIRLLAQESGNLFLVGDEDQTIYGFRAAYPQALTRFRETWPQGVTLLLETNYRSSGSIVERADAFIRGNTGRADKRMRTPNGPGAPVRVTDVRSRAEQYPLLARRAAENTGELAILYRNHESALPLIDLLEKAGTPYTCRKMGHSFFSHPVVQDVKDLLAFAKAPQDRELFFRLYYKLRCGVTREMAAQAAQESFVRGGTPILSLLAARCGVSWRAEKLYAAAEQLAELAEDGSLDAVERISRELGYREYLRAKGADESKLDVLEALARQNPTQAGFLARLDVLEQLAAAPREEPTGLILSTVHGSKGLEYEKVILLDAIDGVFPPEPDPADAAGREALEEERRLFYVAATRAREELELLRVTGCRCAFVTEFSGQRALGQSRPAPKPGADKGKRFSPKSR